MRFIVFSIEAEYRRYKHLGDSAVQQLSDTQLCARNSASDNCVATIVWHIAGNLASRFTDFLSTDGEKPWRDREKEFSPRNETRNELLAFWEKGWNILWQTLSQLHDEQLSQLVTIRSQQLSVIEALHRSLAHTSYHVGQIVYLAKHQLGVNWQYLSIPPGKSAEYNQNPTLERQPKKFN